MSELLTRAVLLDDERLVSGLLSSGADPNERSGPLGRTALQLAARNDRPAIAAALLDRGADADAASRDSLTALHVAAANRSAAMVRLLLERGARPDPPARFNGKSPLYVAVERAGLEVARLLLEGGASLLDSRVGGTTALHLAARLESTELARTILELAKSEEIAEIINVRENIEGKTALHIAVEREDLELCRLLLKHGARADEPCGHDVDDDPSTDNVSVDSDVATDEYCSDEDDEERDDDEDEDEEPAGGWYPLSYAVERQNERLASLLLRHGARATAGASLRRALRYRYRRLAQLLLRSGAASVAGGERELRLAVDTGRADLVELCLGHGASPGPASLRRAIARGDARIVELLLNGGASANQRLDKLGTRPLDLAARARDVALARLLLRRGGALNGAAPAREQAFVVRQLAVLEAEGVGMIPANRRLVDGPWHGLLRCCRREIQAMRQANPSTSVRSPGKIAPSTLYGLLVREEDGLAMLARSEELAAAFRRGDHLRGFPQYAETLTLNYARGRLRCKLLERSARELCDGPACESTYNVLRLLSNEELRILGRPGCEGRPRPTALTDIGEAVGSM